MYFIMHFDKEQTMLKFVKLSVEIHWLVHPVMKII